MNRFGATAYYLGGPDSLIWSKKDAYVFLGQSNSVGQQKGGNITNPQRTGITGTYSAVTFRQKTAQVRADPPTWSTDYTGSLQGYSSSVANVSGATTNLLGPAHSFGRHMDYYRPGKVVVGNFAISGTDLAGDWNPSGGFPSTGGNLFSQAIAGIKALLASTNSTLRAIIWCQCEADAATNAQASAYSANLQNLVTQLRSYFPGVAFIFYKLSSANTGGSFVSTVRSQQDLAAAAISNCSMINVDDLTLTDGTHFDANSYAVLGNRLAAATISLLGWPSPVAWTIDPTSLIACPANATEIAAFLSAAGVSSGGPSAGWGMQDAGPNLADFVNSHTLTASGTNIVYAQTTPQWARKCMGFAATNAGQLVNTDGTLPNPASASWARLVWGFWAKPSSTYNAWVIGTSGFATIGATTTGWRITDGANITAGATDPTNQIRPFIHARNVTAPSVRAMTDIEKLVGTKGTVTGLSETLGQTSIDIVNSRYLYGLEFHGTAAEKTDAEWRSIITTANWCNANLGAGASIAW